MTLTATELAARYALLCKSTRADPTGDPQGLRLAPHLSALRTLLRHDLRALGRQGSPDDFADICFELEQELERFQEFCAFPPLAQKFVVAFGGGFSAGKSSLINALLGKRLLVTEVDPTTSLPTYLLQGKADTIHAQNLFGDHIDLSDEEFLSLTHDEIEHYGSNVSRLLRSAIISRQDFPWQNLTLIDTPGYTKHEDQQHSERTDEHIARTQLNSAQAIVWVIDARQGCITEDDIRFLASLRPEIPRLIALSRADQKPLEDIADILKGIRATLETRNLPFLDVVAVSARKKDWPFTPILEQLARWNGAPRELRFAHNFKHQFTRYSRHLDDERRQAQQHLNRLNRILGLSDEDAIQEDARELKDKTSGLLQTTERLQGELGALRHRFFVELKLIGDHVGIAMPEPSALELLDGAQGFDLLEALRQRREADGKPAPDEPASLRELGQPGETPKIAAFLSGETDIVLDAHFAADLDAHCRETYARFLAAVIGYGQGALSEMQGALFLKLLESLGLPDIRTKLLAQAREMTAADLQECRRVVCEHGLANNLFFDALLLGRCGAVLDSKHVSLLAELGECIELGGKNVAGMPILAGYVLGLHQRTDYAASEVLELIHWHPLFFRKLKKADYKSGVLSGYFKQKKGVEIKIYWETINLTNLILSSEGLIKIRTNLAHKISNSTLRSNILIELSGESLVAHNMEAQSKESIIIEGQSVNIEHSRWSYTGNKKNGHLELQGVLKMHQSKASGWEVDIVSPSTDISNSQFIKCKKISLNRCAIDDVILRESDFSTAGDETILEVDFGSSYHTSKVRTMSVLNCIFSYPDLEKSDVEAIRIKGVPINPKDPLKIVAINTTKSNVIKKTTTPPPPDDRWGGFSYNQADKTQEIIYLLSK